MSIAALHFFVIVTRKGAKRPAFWGRPKMEAAQHCSAAPQY